MRVRKISVIFKCIVPLISGFIFHTKIKIQSSFTHLHVVHFQPLSKTQKEYVSAVFAHTMKVNEFQNFWNKFRGNLSVHTDHQELCILFVKRQGLFITTLSCIINNQMWTKISSILIRIQDTSFRRRKNIFKEIIPLTSPASTCRSLASTQT